MFFCELQEILTPFLWKISGWLLLYYKFQFIELKITLLPTILKEDMVVFSSALTKKTLSLHTDLSIKKVKNIDNPYETY